MFQLLTIAYCPGSRNIKPDALSHQYTSEVNSSHLDTILLADCVVAVLTWGIEKTVREAQQQESDPGNGPVNRSFVPQSVHSQVLQWAHTSYFACHLGANRTISLFKRHFWWPALESDTWEYVAACITCADSKAHHRSPAGLLQPLSIPGQPRSHIALDFITRLPPSKGTTLVLTVIDRFSKAAHFIALPKLPSAIESVDKSCHSSS